MDNKTPGTSLDQSPIVVRPGQRDRGGTVSIIVITCGQLELTRLCLPSLLWHSRPPVELFILDLDSLDGTEHYLDGVASASTVPVHVVSIDQCSNLMQGFGLVTEQAKGQYIAIVSNDVVVPPLWLDQLTALLEADPMHGMVGPMANYAPTQQYAGHVPYRIDTENRPGAALKFQAGNSPSGLLEFCQFAERWRQAHRGKWLKTNFLGGFCLLMKHDLISHVTVDSQHHGRGHVDEKKLCESVLAEGFNIVCCNDLYVHHFGTRMQFETR